MITDNPDTNSSPSESPSSPPMILRQQLLKITYDLREGKYDTDGKKGITVATKKIERLCQEIAREAEIKQFNRLWDSAQADNAVKGATQMMHELNTVRAELTQKPPKEEQHE